MPPLTATGSVYALRPFGKKRNKKGRRKDGGGKEKDKKNDRRPPTRTPTFQHGPIPEGDAPFNSRNAGNRLFCRAIFMSQQGLQGGGGEIKTSGPKIQNVIGPNTHHRQARRGFAGGLRPFWDFVKKDFPFNRPRKNSLVRRGIEAAIRQKKPVPSFEWFSAADRKGPWQLTWHSIRVRGKAHA